MIQNYFFPNSYYKINFAQRTTCNLDFQFETDLPTASTFQTPLNRILSHLNLKLLLVVTTSCGLQVVAHCEYYKAQNNLP